MDPYQVLGVPRYADLTALRRAYHRQALHCHPDVGGSTVQMRRLSDAYAAAVRAARLRAQGTDTPAAHDRERGPAPSPRDSTRPITWTADRWHPVGVWMRERRSGQWALTLLMLAAIHQLASLVAPAGGPPPLLELLAMALAVRVQAAATPRGRVFVPPGDALACGLSAIRVLAWLVRER